MTPLVIRTVERMAERQGIKSIKFKNRKGELMLPPIDIISGEERSDEESIPDLIIPGMKNLTQVMMEASWNQHIIGLTMRTSHS